MKTKQKRAGRVLSAANEGRLNEALGQLTGAVDAIRGVLSQLDERTEPVKRRELRFFPLTEVRMEEVAGEPTLSGYAAVYNQLSVDFGGWREIIRPGAFTASLTKGPDTRANVDHMSGLSTLGRTRNGTLELAEDAQGLRVVIRPPDTQPGRDVLTLVKRGDLNQMSFAFFTIQDNWLQTGEEMLRELHEVDIDGGDVSIVTYPAYPQTSVQMRSLMNLPEIPENVRGQGSASDIADEAAARARSLLNRRRRLLLLEN